MTTSIRSMNRRHAVTVLRSFALLEVDGCTAPSASALVSFAKPRLRSSMMPKVWGDCVAGSSLT